MGESQQSKAALSLHFITLVSLMIIIFYLMFALLDIWLTHLGPTDLCIYT